MTKREALIISAYTGYLLCDMDELHKFIEKTLGRPVFTHELAQDNILDEIRLKLKDSFIEIIKNTDKTEEAEQALKECESK